MISHAQIKLIRSLELKKNRDALGLFVAEGPKLVGELLPYFGCELIAGTNRWLSAHPDLSASAVCPLTEVELCRASLMRAPQEVVGVFRKPAPVLPSDAKSLVVAIDGVQDPGNLGTIVRLCDWFGVKNVVCSADSADVFGPKAVQATMGGIARVSVAYTDLPAWIAGLKNSAPVYGTLLDGRDIYEQPLTTGGVVVMGSEGRGLSADVARLVTHRLLIPSYPAGGQTTQSLNVSTATAIVLSEFRRRARSGQ